MSDEPAKDDSFATIILQRKHDVFKDPLRPPALSDLRAGSEQELSTAAPAAERERVFENIMLSLIDHNIAKNILLLYQHKIHFVRF